MGRRASRWPAILTGPEQILEAHWPSLFRAAPRPVQQALLADGNDRRIHGDVLEVKDANYSRRFGSEMLGRVGMPARAAGYGDVLACVAALWGLSVQDPSAEELDGKHPCFPPVACAHADKPA